MGHGDEKAKIRGNITRGPTYLTKTRKTRRKGYRNKIVLGKSSFHHLESLSRLSPRRFSRSHDLQPSSVSATLRLVAVTLRLRLSPTVSSVSNRLVSSPSLSVRQIISDLIIDSTYKMSF
ncbi:hypothetical protein F2Q69_00037712 [Brassica cretica]|uniref:Uncharacterized protein n=1 Tax=Brassica cretica TaxID=69181 RepID=A0A8S9SI01_BRACR|nr:hypothetical protein F2Q69_00037712 [Brassica cretica]